MSQKKLFISIYASLWCCIVFFCLSGPQCKQKCVYDGPSGLSYEQHFQPELCGRHAHLLSGLHRRSRPQLWEPRRSSSYGRAFAEWFSGLWSENKPDGSCRGPDRIHLSATAAGSSSYALPPVFPEPTIPSGRPELPGSVGPASPSSSPRP